MSFKFEWPRFSDQFHADAIKMLDSALNKGTKPPVIADKIEVVELEMGTQPPELEIRDVGELTTDQFRGIFRLTYDGDAHIVLRTKVQANPLNHKQPDIHLMGGSRGMLAAKHPLVVPMLLRLSHFKLDSYVVLVVSKQKGITLVFKTDPLQHVDINSTFDSIAVIQKFIQHEIEGQLRQMFREDLPGIIHRLSQQWVKAKVEAPYLNKRPSPVRAKTIGENSTYPLTSHLPPGLQPLGLYPMLARRPASVAGGIERARSTSLLSSYSVDRRSMPSMPSPSPSTGSYTPPQEDASCVFPDIEHFDPTYGLRPEGLPTKSVFKNFRGLFSPNKGLAELTEEGSEAGDDVTSYDIAPWEDLISEPGFNVRSSSEIDDVGEYETVPAVGGGTITRPRVVHAQSQIMSPVGDIPPVLPRSSTRSLTRARSSISVFEDTGSIFSSLPSIRSSLSIPPPSQPWTGLHNPYLTRPTSAYQPSVSEMVDDREEYLSIRGRYNPRYNLPSSPPSSIPIPLLEESTSRLGSPSSGRTRNSRSTGLTRSLVTPPNAESDDGDIHVARTRRSSFGSAANLERFGSPPDSYFLSRSEHDPKIVLKPGLSAVSRLATLSHSNFTLSPYTQTLEHFTGRSVPPRESASSGSGSAGERQPVKARRKRTFYLGGKAKKGPEQEQEHSPSKTTSPEPPLSDFNASDMDRYFRYRDDLTSQYPDYSPSHVPRHSPRYRQ